MKSSFSYLESFAYWPILDWWNTQQNRLRKLAAYTLEAMACSESYHWMKILLPLLLRYSLVCPLFVDFEILIPIRVEEFHSDLVAITKMPNLQLTERSTWSALSELETIRSKLVLRRKRIPGLLLHQYQKTMLTQHFLHLEMNNRSIVTIIYECK